MLRLRAGFGVGIKSDLLAVLIGFHGRRIPVRTLVQATDYVAASTLRDLFDDHRQAFERNEISVPDVSGPTGERFVEVFRTIILDLADWIADAIRGSAPASPAVR